MPGMWTMLYGAHGAPCSRGIMWILLLGIMDLAGDLILRSTQQRSQTQWNFLYVIKIVSPIEWECQPTQYARQMQGPPPPRCTLDKRGRLLRCRHGGDKRCATASALSVESCHTPLRVSSDVGTGHSAATNPDECRGIMQRRDMMQSAIVFRLLQHRVWGRCSSKVE